MRYAALALALLSAASAQQTFTYKTAGTLAIQADVFHPPGDTATPAILWIHGGALIAGHRGNLRADQRKRYNDAGYTVVSIDYRLAPETKAVAILDDVRDAYQWMRREARTLRIRADRIAVIGHSAGGYLTLTCGYRLKPKPRALVAFYGYGDIAAPWYSRPDPFYLQQPAVSKEDAYASVGSAPLSGAPGGNNRFRFYLYLRQHGLWNQEVAGYDPDKQPRAFDALSPARRVTRAWPPTMLLHGDKDTDVPFQQSEQMAALFEKRSVPHEFVRIPAGPHGFDGRKDSPGAAAAFDRVLAFLKKHLP